MTGEKKSERAEGGMISREWQVDWGWCNDERVRKGWGSMEVREKERGNGLLLSVIFDSKYVIHFNRLYTFIRVACKRYVRRAFFCMQKSGAILG